MPEREAIKEALWEDECDDVTELRPGGTEGKGDHWKVFAVTCIRDGEDHRTLVP